MKVSDFSFDLPSELIAQRPAEPRDSARLLIYDRATDTIEHRLVRDLPDLLPPASTIVANNSKVRHSRLWGLTERGKQIELFVLAPEASTYHCLLGGSGVRAYAGSISLFVDAARSQRINMTAEVVASISGPGMQTYSVQFNGTDDVEAELERYAELPLPPYISGRTSANEQYQTVFAKELGSAAAPTAGLHFTPELIARLIDRGMTWNEITLHVGLGTFLPLRNEEIDANRLHSERCHVCQSVADAVNGPCMTLAIGTTTARTLESHCLHGTVSTGWEETEIFIRPGFTFKAVDCLLTNFHLPKSSLLLLVAAFIGNTPRTEQLSMSAEEMKLRLLRIYNEAITRRYRFFSFGDAMLLL